MTTRSPLRQFIEGHLEGRSWNWLGRSLADGTEPVSGTTVRNWADGRHEMPAFRADQIAVVLGVDPNEVRQVAGLEQKEGGHAGDAAAKTLPVAGIGPETGRVVYEVISPKVGASLTAIPHDNVDIAELAEQMRRLADIADAIIANQLPAAESHPDDSAVGSAE